MRRRTHVGTHRDAFRFDIQFQMLRICVEVRRRNVRGCMRPREGSRNKKFLRKCNKIKIEQSAMRDDENNLMARRTFAFISLFLVLVVRP